jgi:hypothetical protein
MSRLRIFAAALAFVVLAQAVPSTASARSSLRNSKAALGDCQPAVCAPVCVPTELCQRPRCIDYRHHRFLRCKYDPCSTNKVVLQVPDYCCCCLVEVPVCVPCCCEGAPSVCSHKGIFGRSVVEYRWCCGFHLKVIFDRCGDVTVHSYGL